MVLVSTAITIVIATIVYHKVGTYLYRGYFVLLLRQLSENNGE